MKRGHIYFSNGFRYQDRDHCRPSSLESGADVYQGCLPATLRGPGFRFVFCGQFILTVLLIQLAAQPECCDTENKQ